MFCRASAELMSLRLDGLLEPKDIVRLDTHIQDCGTCRAQWSALREADSVLRLSSRRPVSPPADFSARVMARIAVTPAVRPPLWERARTQQIEGGRPTIRLAPTYNGARVAVPVGFTAVAPSHSGRTGLLQNFHPLQGRRMRLYLGSLSGAGVLSLMLLIMAGLLWPAGSSPLPPSMVSAMSTVPDMQAAGAWLASGWGLLRGVIIGIDPWLAAAGTLVVAVLGGAWWRIVGIFASRATGREIST
ncbi:MAG: anti-sigma factor family protein [Chloroflexia bacterium]